MTSWLRAWLTRLAAWLLQQRAKLEWRDFEKHISTCDKRVCIWWRANGLPEDQDETMFCFKGSKLWSKHWDTSHTAGTL